ncbi:serine/threonine-protein kinase [Spirillospora sp. NPDC052242]
MSGWRVPEYTELRVLGEGAQGRVVLARHDATGLPAAIKYLAAGLAADPGFRVRFRAEADLLRRLRNPYVARLYGLVETGEGAAIVMEAVDGASLREVLAERGPLAPEAALAVLKGSLLGLAAAHDVGIVHRDYKPANVIVRGDGLSKLIDFGIAVDAGEAGRSGTPVYMAPEQWRDEPASPATDVYAATCVFFECVTGRRPYTAEDRAGLMGRHLTAPIPVEDVPEPLRPLVESGLAKDPWERPRGAAAFVTELEAAAAAAYGPDWEGRGVRTLATAAAALSMLFPLTALGLGSGGAAASGTAAAGAAGASGAGAAGAGGAGAGGGAAGTAGAGAAGKGVVGALGAKGAAAVAGGAAAVAIGGTAVYVTASDAEPPPQRLDFRTVALQVPAATLNGGGTFQVEGQVVRVTGFRDRALQDRVNRAVRAPLDRLFASNRRGLADLPGSFTNVVTPTVLLRNDRLLSVWYETNVQGNVGTGWNPARAVTVDLTDGTEYRPIDLFRDPAPQGVRPLNELVPAHLPGGVICVPEFGDRFARDIRAEDLREEQVVVGLTPSGIRVGFHAAVLGYVSACGKKAADIPYAQADDLLKPDLLAAVPYPGGSPSPARS